MQFEQPSATVSTPTTGAEPWWRRLRAGRAGAFAVLQRAATWEGVALGAILLLALFLSTWRLSRNGFANEYYSAAVLSATHSWKAFFFGSLDAQNFITVDKPPLALWPQAISARLFGLNAWSLLLPQALMAVASVAVLYRVVRLTAGRAAALVAAVGLAVSPVSVAVSRDNIPDSLLTLLLLLSAWGLLSSMRSGHWLPLLLSAVAIGLAFNTKMLQAYLVLPGFVLVYLICDRAPVRARIGRLAAAGAVVLVVSWLWIGAMTVIPAGSRPYVGGSTDNSAINLLVNYNGIGRLTGADDTPGPGLGNAGPHFGGDASLTRLFNDQLAGEISWLLPPAIFGLVVALAASRGRGRTDIGRSGTLIWGGWFLVHAGVFSLQEGIFHPYYTAALAPSVAALAGIGGVAAWRLSRTSFLWAALTVAAIGGTALWARHVLGWTPDWHAWLSPTILAAAIAACLGWPARPLLLWDPLESTCRHASLSIL